MKGKAMTEPKRGNTKTKTVNDAAEGTAEMPEWATRPVEDSELELFVPPAESQWRRNLTEYELLAWVTTQVRNVDPDDDRMGMEIFAQVAMATSIDEVLTGKTETTKGRDILDQILECDAIRFIQSTERGGCPFFVILSVKSTNNNKHEVVSMGGWMLVAQAAQLHYMSTELPADSPFLVDSDFPGALAKETFPHYFRIKQKPTANGHMNYLVPAHHS